MKFVGLDISITETGFCVLNHNGELATFGSIPTKVGEPDVIRFFNIVDSLCSEIEPGSDDKFMIEQYAYASKGNITRIAELGGMVKYQLYAIHGVPANNFWVATPQSLKKYATGSGAVGKGSVIKAVYKKWNFDTENDNVADAFVLAKLMRAVHEWPSTKPELKYESDTLKAVFKRNSDK